MILEHKRFDLFGKMLFEKAVIVPPFKKPNPMNDEACFLYIMDGQNRCISESDTIAINATEAVLMKCGNYISEMKGSEFDNKRYEAIAVHFYPEVLKKIYQDKLPKFLTARMDEPTGGMQKINSDMLIKRYIEGLLFYFNNPSLVEEEILVLKLKEIILLLNQTKNALAIRAILSNLFNPTTFYFRQIIQAHLYSNLTIEELAELTNMSVSTFKREFRKIYDTSPAQYIKRRKLKKAQELLSISTSRLSDVAFDCGFTNLSHFSKAFKQHFNLTPSEYQLNYLENHWPN